jgi:hypothetical protein
MLQHQFLAAVSIVLMFCCIRLSFADEKSSLQGRVLDPDGRPIPGAMVSISGTSITGAQGAGILEKRPARTDPDGAYTLPVRMEPDVTVMITRVAVVAPGFVRFDEDFDPPLILKAGEPMPLDFVLAPGEILSGRVDVPITRGERHRGIRPDERIFGIIIRGPSYKRMVATEMGGRFEVWVPRGPYSLELVGEPGWPLIRLDNIPSGSRDLKLALVEPKITEQVLAEAFDALWRDMDRNYSYFDLKQIDWDGLRNRYRQRAVEAGTARGFVNVLDEMLAELQDGHVWIQWGNETIVPYVSPPQDENYNQQATLASLKDLVHCGDFAVIGKTKEEGFAAFVLTRQSKAGEASVQQAVKLLQEMRDAPGFLVDLRRANGGNEVLAREIARQFCEKDTVYAKSKYRDGESHSDFGPTYERVLKAIETPIRRPVVCLIGPFCVSSGEAFAKMMKCLPQVTTVGAHTRGSSGNPKPFKLPFMDVTVFYSRWVDMLPDETPIEGNGVTPDVEFKFSPEAYRGADPTWEEAITVLRRRIDKSQFGHRR